ncbi:hypothetical protein ACQRUO_38420, partial [Kitasatospora sp. LaBMicrA B282]
RRSSDLSVGGGPRPATVAAPAVAAEPAPAPAAGPEPDRDDPLDTPTRQLAIVQLPGAGERTTAAAGTPTERTPVPPPGADTPVTELGLPRRVPRSGGLPGTGEMPASELRRLAAGSTEPAGPATAAPATDGPAGTPPGAAQTPSGAAQTPPSVTPPTAAAVPGERRPRTSAEELRRRLGGFQSGLRQAARESAVEEAEEQDR